MFETSSDILYGVIAICVLFFTAFLCWGLYYIVQILKQGNEVITDIREKIVEFEQVLDSIKSKVALSATSIAFVAKEIKTIVDFVKEKKEKKSTRRKKE